MIQDACNIEGMSFYLRLARTSKWSAGNVVRRASDAFRHRLDEACDIGEEGELVPVLLAAAETIDEFCLGRFEAGGLGQSRPWPSDVFGELSMIIDELPNIIDAIRHDVRTELGFLEQGCGRVVCLEPSGNSVRVLGGGSFGGLPWEPHDAVLIKKAELIKMLQSLIDVFAGMVCDLEPQVAGIQSFCQWRAPR